MNQASKDWTWAASIACTLTAISTAALITSVEADVSSPIQRLSSMVSHLGAPGAVSGAVLAVLLTGSYGGSGKFIVIIASLVNLALYTIGIYGAVRLFRAVRKRAN
jgi:hypothetical protein